MTAPIVDPALDALWKNVLDHWDDDKAHTAFLEHCRHQDQLVEAAVRYRGMAGDRARSEIAERRLKAVAILAMTKLESGRSTTPEARSQLSNVALIALFLLLTVAVLAVYPRC